jgi:putative ABC transport system permease protein
VTIVIGAVARRAGIFPRMKYLPLVWAAFRRHTTESLLTFAVLTIAFTLFSSMVALRSAYEQAINVNRMDRLLVSARFCCSGLSIARRDEVSRMPGVQGAAALQWVFGFHQEPSMRVGVLMLDQAGTNALPELRLTPEHWKQMAEKPTGLFFSRAQATEWKVKAGDRFVIQTSAGREANSRSWPFEVLGIVDNPDPPVLWAPNIYGNYEYFQAVRAQDPPGAASFMVAIDDPDDAEPICQKVDTRYANSATPTYCVPLQVDARSIFDAVISMREMSFGIAGAGLFMILFLCANGVAESVRERIPEFAVLKTIGFGDRQVAALVFLEAALPSIAGAVLGTGLAAALSRFTSRLGEGSEIPLPPASISIWIVALALGAALLIGAASAILPLRRLKALELAPALAER